MSPTNGHRFDTGDQDIDTFDPEFFSVLHDEEPKPKSVSVELPEPIRHPAAEQRSVNHDIKLAPHDLQSEQCVLACAVLNAEALVLLMGMISRKHFYSDIHGMIWDASIAVHKQGKPVDVVTLGYELERRGQLAEIGGAMYLLTVIETVPHSGNARFYAQKVIDVWISRTIQQAALELVEATRDPSIDIEELVTLSRINDRLDFDTSSSKFLSAGELFSQHPEMRRPLFHGLLRVGESMNVIGSPKRGKSWLVLLMIFSFIMGWRLFDRFWATPGRVLLIDNELHLATLSARIKRVADALGLTESQYSEKLTIWSLRGKLQDINGIARQLSSIRPGTFDLIVVDAFYRVLPSGVDENSNSSIAGVYNTIDHILGLLECGGIFIHHASKGNQAGKSVTDVGAGAGSQSRATDTHMVIREHEAENVVVVDAVTRSNEPPEPFCLRWEFPTWMPADDCDPADLKQERPRRKHSAKDEDSLTPEEKQQQADEERRGRLLKAYQSYPNGETASELRAVANLSGTMFKRTNRTLLDDGIVREFELKKNGRTERGFVLVSGRSDRSDRSDKTDIRPGCPTDSDGGGWTGCSPLGDTRPSDRPPELDSEVIQTQRELSGLSGRESTNTDYF